MTWRHILQWPGIFREALFDYFGDKAARQGAALAYYATFSIAPILVILIGVAGLVFGEEAVRGQVFSEIEGLLGSRSARTIESMLANIQQQETSLLATIMGLGLLFIGATGVYVALQDALFMIWGVELKSKHDLLNVIKKRGIAFVLVLASGSILGVSLLLSTALSAAVGFFGDFLPPALRSVSVKVLHQLLPFLVATVHFAMIYKIVPAIPLRWGDVWVGAAVTSFLFNVGKWGIEFYISHSSVITIFGAGSSLVILLLWVYYSSQIILLGAEFTKVYTRRLGSQSGRGRRTE